MQIPDNVKLYETPISTLWLDSDGILCGISKPTERSIEHYKFQFEVFKSLLKSNEKHCLLVDAKNQMPMSSEIREYLIVEMPRYVKAQAIISPKHLETSLNSTFLKISFEGFPIRMFNNETEARTWLKLFK